MAERATVAVIDGGGRGAALVEAYGKSPHVERIIAIPGNDLMQINTEKPVVTFQHLKTTDSAHIVTLAKDHNVSLVDVAQDNAIAVGLVNSLQEAGIPALGPTRLAGQIEWSKAYARDLGQKIGLRQPEYAVYASLLALKSDKREEGYAKADGLAEGKGAKRFSSKKEQLQRVRELRRQFPDAAKVYLIEELLVGEELSAFAFVSGLDTTLIGTAQDNKKALNFDEGNNTGGMGGHTPPFIATQRVLEQLGNNFQAIAQALEHDRRPYKGVMYQGGMIDAQENVSVIEFNSRWGDPEAQLLLPGFQFDIYEAAMVMIEGGLKDFDLPIDGKTRVVFTAASRGYPEDYSGVKGKRVWGLEEIVKMDHVHLYGAGVKRKNGIDYANGGRLFYVVAEGENVIEARERGHAALSHASVEDNNLHYRDDMAWRDVQRLRLQT